MMRTHKIAGMLAATLIWAGASTALAQHEGHGHEQHKHGKMQEQDKSGEKEKETKLPLCPVMGDPVDFTVKTMTDDGPVYFCCPMCIKKFEEKPEQYADKVAKQRKQLRERERIQVACPITGKPVNKKVSSKQGDETVYFCCAGCKPKYEANPDKYEAKLEASYTYQTHCPIMGGKINPTAFADLPTGERIYFCCPGCDKKLLSDPEKYAKNLEKQGIHLDVKKLKKALAENKDAKKKMMGHENEHAGHDHP